MNAMFNLLFDVNGFHFQNLYVFSKSLFEPKYQMVEELVKSVSDNGIDYFAFSKNKENRLQKKSRLRRIQSSIFTMCHAKSKISSASTLSWSGTAVWSLFMCIKPTARHYITFEM